MKPIKPGIKKIIRATLAAGLTLVLTLLLGSSCKKPCQPVSVYGPRPCQSDEECVKQNGEGWYCNQDHAYDTGCGQKAVWPVCEPKK